MDHTQPEEILDLISEKYVLCPGIKPSFYEDKIGVTRYHRENVCVLTYPLLRYESVSCLLWYQPCNKYTRYEHDLHNVCRECKVEVHRVIESAEQRVLLSPKERDPRLYASSKYLVSKLSLASTNEKVKCLKHDRKRL